MDSIPVGYWSEEARVMPRQTETHGDDTVRATLKQACDELRIAVDLLIQNANQMHMHPKSNLAVGLYRQAFRDVREQTVRINEILSTER